jgi:hypothetical protein
LPLAVSLVVLVVMTDKSQGVLTGLIDSLPRCLPLLAFWLGARPPRSVADRNRTQARRSRLLMVWLVLLANPLGLVAMAMAIDGTWLAGEGILIAAPSYLVLATVTFALLGRWLRRRWPDDPVSSALVLPPVLLSLAPMLLPGVIDKPAILVGTAVLMFPPVAAFAVGLLGIPRRRVA